MPIRLVILDLDETLWRGKVYFMELPFKRLNESIISDLHGQRIRIYPKTRELLVSLRDLQIPRGIASWNFRDKAEEAMKLFGILEFFPEPLRKIWLERGRMKHLMIQEIIKEIRKVKPSLKYSEILYYDDDRSYFERVWDMVSPEIRCLQAGVDLKTPYEILGYIQRTRER